LRVSSHRPDPAMDLAVQYLGTQFGISGPQMLVTGRPRHLLGVYSPYGGIQILTPACSAGCAGSAALFGQGSAKGPVSFGSSSPASITENAEGPRSMCPRGRGHQESRRRLGLRQRESTRRRKETYQYLVQRGSAR